MTPRRAGPPLLLIHDESPGLGGSVTSLGALVPFLVRSGWRVEVAPLQSEGWERQGITPHLLRRRGERIQGAGYFAREAVRALDLGALCRRLRPDLLLANNGPTANLATHLAGRSLGLPVAQYVRGPFPPSGLAGKILRSAAVVFTVGDECTQLARLVGRVTPAQVEEGLDPVRWPITRGAEARAWLWSSALVDWKGLPLLFEAYRALGEGAPPLHVCYTTLLAGHPDAVQAPADPPPGVVLHRAPANLDAIRACASVYVHTALRPEPFGRAVLEAMAAGLCPVVPDAGTPGRLVRHGVNGLVYAAGSPTALADGLRRAAADPAACARLGRRAAVDARAYRSDRVFGPVLTALERIRAEGRARSVPPRDENTLEGRDPAWRGS
jgi:glycosyltransferase involved in cell wall biosynthesis